eukprot:scaffold304447_cov15-Tisochrysis_lutea.AAC.1
MALLFKRRSNRPDCVTRVPERAALLRHCKWAKPALLRRCKWGNNHDEPRRAYIWIHLQAQEIRYQCARAQSRMHWKIEAGPVTKHFCLHCQRSVIPRMHTFACVPIELHKYILADFNLGHGKQQIEAERRNTSSAMTSGSQCHTKRAADQKA